VRVTASSGSGGAGRTEAQYQRLFEVCPLPAWITDDVTGRALAANDAALKETGLSREAFLARPSDALGLVAFPGWHTVPLEFDERAAHLTIVIGAAALFEAEDAEAARVAESERHHREIVETSSDLVTVVSQLGVIDYMSPSVDRILGWSPDAVVGRSILAFIHPEDMPKVRDAMRVDQDAPAVPQAVEYRFRHKDGSWRVLESVGQLRPAGPGSYTFVVNSRDVTERRVADERQAALMRALSEAHRTAEAATRAKSDFLANMSHEIRTPLNAVLGLTELLLDTDLKSEQRRQLELVRDAGDTLLTLLNDILDLSKIEAEQVELERIPISIPGVVHATASLFSLGAREHGLEMLVDIGQGVPRYVSGDPTRLRQVLTNLIGNAIKFTNEGEVVVSARLEHRDGDDALIRFAVRDSGVGIPPAKLETVFKDFSQADASTTRRYGGTGLGLSISQRLVHLMGGHIAVTSTVGEGSEFAFTLRLPVAGAPATQESTDPVRLAGVSALVVDDNATNRRLVREILTPLGCAVTEASGAIGAIAALERAIAEGLPFQVLLLDAQMPECDGWSLAARIRERPEMLRTRLLMLTSEDMRDDLRRASTIGVDGYLVKPVSRAELVKAMTALLDGPRSDPSHKLVTRGPPVDTRERLQILLAEDNAVNQEVAAALLRKRGHDVRVVDYGAQAVAAVEAAGPRHFDIVLMDLHMPNLDGLAATAAIRRLPAGEKLPIIALTADALAGEREDCLAVGMNGFLAKPFKTAELFAIVEHMAASRARSADAPPAEAPLAAAVSASVDMPPADIDGFRAAMREAGAEDAVDRILDKFVIDAPKRAAAVASALARGDAAAIQREAHAFKSSSASLGAARLAAHLQAIEISGKEGRVADAQALAGAIQHDVDSLLTYLRALRAEALSHG
jgi:PAS domain S-box-containing protein